MNPRDLPEVGAELIIKRYEGRSALNSRVDQLEQPVANSFKALREEICESSRATVEGTTRGFEPFLAHLREYGAQLR